MSARTIDGGRARRWSMVLGGALAALLLLPGLATAAGLQLTDADNGKTVTVIPKTLVTITLKSNITTGYQWVVLTAPDAKVAELVPGTGQYVPPTSTLIGAGGTQVFEFRGVAAGATALELGYKRANDTSAAETYRLDISVVAVTALPPTSTDPASSPGAPVAGLVILALVAVTTLGLYLAARRRAA